MWEDLVAWLLSLGDEYGVDTLVYAVIYVGAAPLFFGSVAWLVNRLQEPRTDRPACAGDGVLLRAFRRSTSFGLGAICRHGSTPASLSWLPSAP